MSRRGWTYVCGLLTLSLCNAAAAAAATVYVAAGGDLQTALNNAKPGDTILLAEGAEFVGNFVLPVKSGTGWITVRSAAPDSVLPPAGRRIHPSHAPLLARLRSPNSSAALKTAAGTHHWVLAYLEFAGNYYGYGDILQIGDGSSAQNSLAKVPHDIVLHHLYVHGDPELGQKRGIALNAARVTIADSYIAECKGVGQDTQAIAGWNGPGPYLIENNYLEAAGENFMLGGADPSIANLVPDGVTFRRNYLSRPMSWRDPILAAPQAVTAAAEAGGALPAGTYSYRVVARRQVYQGSWVRSAASAEATVSVAIAGGAVRVRWQPVAGASEYRVYGRSAGAQNAYWRVTSTELLDGGAAGTAEAVPTGKGTMWSVKNLFELKNARNVLIENNVLENHWQESQAGYSVVFTPRNSNGTCTWCTVENVRFEYNVVRNVSGGVNLLAHDSPAVSGIATNVALRHNLFTRVTTSLGGSAWFLLVGQGPRDLTVEHNTIDSNGGSVVYTYGGSSTAPAVVEGFQMVANAARHGYYGMMGDYFPYGNGILSAYYPDSVFTANYLAAGPASRYPAGNLFAGNFPDQFVDAAGGDYTVAAGSLLKGAAPDGSDIGADFAALTERTAGVELGVTPGGAPVVPPTADFTTACTDLDCTFADASVAGTSPIASRTWYFGDASGGTGTVATHTYALAGTYQVTLTIRDGAGLSSTASTLVSVKAPVLPSDLLVSSLSAPTAAPAGTTIYVSDTTGNIGSGTAQASRTRFWLSADARLDAGDTLLGARDVPQLAAGAAAASSTPLLVPAAVLPGSYIVLARADGDDVVVESNESNNVSSAAITIEADPLDRPDLVVATLTVPAIVSPGATILVTDKTANTGKGAAAASTTRFFLSTTIFLDPSDTALQARSVGALQPATASTGTTAVTIPSGARPGVYYLIAQADAGAAVVETGELNNTRWAAVRIGPDLVVSALTAPTRAVPGGTLAVTDTTRNSGGGVAAASSTAFYVSANTGLDLSDIRLEPSRSVASLASGASSKATTTVTLPVVQAGTWYLIAVADDAGDVEEVSETNNVRFVAVQMGPDLTFLSVIAPSTGAAGGTISVSTTVRNSGTVDAGPSIVRFYISTNLKLDKSDVQLGATRAVPGLAPGASHTATTTVTLPAVAPGAFYLLLVADADQMVPESNEGNNTFTRALQITAP